MWLLFLILFSYLLYFLFRSSSLKRIEPSKSAYIKLLQYARKNTQDEKRKEAFALVEKFIEESTQEELEYWQNHTDENTQIINQAIESQHGFNSANVRSAYILPKTDEIIHNANTMLYLGAFLMVAAAATFIGFNYTVMTNELKFFTLFIFTALFYCGGIYLSSSQKLESASITFTALGMVLIPLLGVAYQVLFFPKTDSITLLWSTVSFVSMISYMYVFFVFKKQQILYPIALSMLSFLLFSSNTLGIPWEYTGIISIIFACGMLFITENNYIPNSYIYSISQIYLIIGSAIGLISLFNNFSSYQLGIHLITLSIYCAAYYITKPQTEYHVSSYFSAILSLYTGSLSIAHHIAYTIKTPVDHYIPLLLSMVYILIQVFLPRVYIREKALLNRVGVFALVFYSFYLLVFIPNSFATFLSFTVLSVISLIVFRQYGEREYLVTLILGYLFAIFTVVTLYIHSSAVNDILSTSYVLGAIIIYLILLTRKQFARKELFHIVTTSLICALTMSTFILDTNIKLTVQSLIVFFFLITAYQEKKLSMAIGFYTSLAILLISINDATVSSWLIILSAYIFAIVNTQKKLIGTIQKSSHYAAIFFALLAIISNGLSSNTLVSTNIAILWLLSGVLFLYIYHLYYEFKEYAILALLSICIGFVTLLTYYQSTNNTLYLLPFTISGIILTYIYKNIRIHKTNILTTTLFATYLFLGLWHIQDSFDWYSKNIGLHYYDVQLFVVSLLSIIGLYYTKEFAPLVFARSALYIAINFLTHRFIHPDTILWYILPWSTYYLYKSYVSYTKGETKFNYYSNMALSILLIPTTLEGLWGRSNSYIISLALGVTILFIGNIVKSSIFTKWASTVILVSIFFITKDIIFSLPVWVWFFIFGTILLGGGVQILKKR